MSKQKRSPGPFYHYKGKLRPEFPKPIHEIHDANGETIVAWSGFDGLSIPKNRIAGNARLLAAADDLLKACERAYNGYIVGDVDPDGTLDVLLAAIQKATGKTVIE